MFCLKFWGLRQAVLEKTNLLHVTQQEAIKKIGVSGDSCSPREGSDDRCYIPNIEKDFRLLPMSSPQLTDHVDARSKQDDQGCPPGQHVLETVLEPSPTEADRGSHDSETIQTGQNFVCVLAMNSVVSREKFCARKDRTDHICSWSRREVVRCRFGTRLACPTK